MGQARLKSMLRGRYFKLRNRIQGFEIQLRVACVMSQLMKKSFLLALLCIAVHSIASPLFDDNAVIDVELIGPIGSLIKKKDDSTEVPFVLKANAVEQQVQIRVRGKSRLRLCKFPPLRLNFSDSDTEQTVFAGQDKIKLVTHCRSNDASQVDALQEYAVYRIFNIISDISYRVRLLHITTVTRTSAAKMT